MNDERDAIINYCDNHAAIAAFSYPHPFTKGGVIFVFPDDVDAWLQHVGAAYALALPGTLHCLRRRELFQLSLPGMFVPPLQVNERPLLPYWLQHRGEVLVGDDIRGEIRPFSPPHLLLAGHVEGCMDYMRRYGIMTAMIHKQHGPLIGMLEREMRYLMSTALLMHQVWDVSLLTLPALFASYCTQDAAMSLWSEIQMLPQETAVYDDAIQAAWLFEQFLQQLRRYAHDTHPH